VALTIPETSVLPAASLAAALRDYLHAPPACMRAAPVPITRPAAVLIPIMSRREGNSILFTRRAANLTHHAGQISFPGGTLSDTDETYAAAALRELEEETGIAGRHVHLAGALPERDTRTGFSVVPVVGVIEEGFRLALQQAEVASVFEVPLTFVMDRRNYRERPMPELDPARVFNTLQYDNDLIWGATANMLVDLVAILNKCAPELRKSLHGTRGNCDL
jgi:8-oxo-dGTP pyrophosphatase MutT (NUDIX family)